MFEELCKLSKQKATPDAIKMNFSPDEPRKMLSHASTIILVSFYCLKVMVRK